MNLTPRGCSSIGGELALSMENTRDTAMRLFSSYGYSPFNPAEFQILSAVLDDLSEQRRDRVIALNTPFGEPCCLRADITISALSYMSTHYAPEDFPLRLCYAERIFAVPKPPKANLEDTQVGLELLGWESIGSDIEVSSMLLRLLDELGLDESIIVLGDSSILPSLISDMPAELSRKLVHAMQRGALREYEDLLASPGIDAGRRRAIEALPWMKGGREIFDEASRSFGTDEHTRSLAAMFDALESLGWKDRIKLDLGCIRDLSYYTGPIFNVYSSERGELLGGGGRYSGKLSESFSCGACGFGLSLRELASVRTMPTAASSVVIWAEEGHGADALRFADNLASASIPFIISWEIDRDKSLETARARGARIWADVSSGRGVELASGASYETLDAIMRHCDER